MIEQFKQHISGTLSLNKGDQTLLAVSGGADSMVMAHLFFKAGMKFAIAHCNFSLRDKESDSDEQLVTKLSQQYEVKLHTTRFDTKKYAKENQVSAHSSATFQFFSKQKICFRDYKI